MTGHRRSCSSCCSQSDCIIIRRELMSMAKIIGVTGAARTHTHTHIMFSFWPLKLNLHVEKVRGHLASCHLWWETPKKIQSIHPSLFLCQGGTAHFLFLFLTGSIPPQPMSHRLRLTQHFSWKQRYGSKQAVSHTHINNACKHRTEAHVGIWTQKERLSWVRPAWINQWYDLVFLQTWQMPLSLSDLLWYWVHLL